MWYTWTHTYHIHNINIVRMVKQCICIHYGKYGKQNHSLTEPDVTRKKIKKAASGCPCQPGHALHKQSTIIQTNMSWVIMKASMFCPHKHLDNLILKQFDNGASKMLPQVHRGVGKALWWAHSCAESAACIFCLKTRTPRWHTIC